MESEHVYIAGHLGLIVREASNFKESVHENQESKLPRVPLRFGD
jgi:hypothetical protein